jgi:glutathione peroxidase
MNVYDFTVKDNKGNDVSLSEYKGKVLLIVNTATKCGLTPQYEGLEKLYEKYCDQGFEILNFPCNQFAFQAPGSAEKIDSFCTLKYNTKFPRFEKIKVNGRDTAPLYKFLKEQKPGRIQWNFAKFLIDKDGNVAERFAPSEKPDSLESSIKSQLSK